MTDPIISRGVVKAAAIVLVAGGLGAGAYVVADGGIDLPDLPETDPTTEQPVISLDETDLSDTTLGGEEVGTAPGEGSDPFTSAGLAAALAEVRAEAGANRKLTRMFINDVQTQFILRDGDEGAEAYSVRADSGELTRSEATITISGNATLDDFEYPLAAVKPAAVDRMLSAARKQSGTEDFEPSVLSLERGIPFGSRTLEWTINARGDGRNLLYRADASGRGLRNVGGEGTPIPPAALEAQKLNDCIQKAGQQAEEIFACLERFQP